MEWAVAGIAVAIWVLLLGALAVVTEPRRVRPGPPTLDPPGSEPAAVVALLTNDWELEAGAVTATVLDLAARRHLALEWVGNRTFVRLRRSTPPGDDRLTPYEAQVMDHVRALAAETSDGFVPAEALTTGPKASARAWSNRFRRAVTADARARGLSRPRWSPATRAALVAWGVAVGITVGIAASTLPVDEQDDDPVGAAIAFGVVTAGGLGVLTGRLRGERDTPAGRAAAADWLGLREMLADDPVFPVQPPAAVAVWGRLMAYGAAMGLSNAAAASLPFGAESDRHAWSPVGDRWRPVRIRYPDVLPPGYGRHPGLVAAVGLAITAVGVVVGPGAVAVGRSVLDGVADLVETGEVPWSVRLTVGIVVGTVSTVAVLGVLAGVSMLVTGIADLVRPRRTVEGRVLRVRRRSRDDDRYYWHVAVDDGRRDRIRAWRMGRSPGAQQGDTVRASVSQWLGHVRDLEVVRSRRAVEPVAVGPPTATPGAEVPAPLPGAAALAAILGAAVHQAAGAATHPLAIAGASATYATDDGGMVVAAWVAPDTIDALRALPRDVAPAIDGVGDEAYRAPAGGGVVARVGDDVVLVSAALPHADPAARDAAVTSVAALVAAGDVGSAP